MTEEKFLKQFQQALMDEKFDCSYIEATDQTFYPRLLLFLGVDDKEREKILEVTAIKQELMQGLDSSDNPFYRIQFHAVFPFNIHPQASTQVSSLICYLNRLIELPGFEMDEINLTLNYRYILLYGERDFNKNLYFSIVGLIMLTLELFNSTLERVARGETTFNQILEEIIKIAQQVKP
ncbi:hypothetical protein [Neochlamydia sp. S13]|uniref:hypothetical protein n=1 Tax=Neochlamydia sp. S13 TaxID=1353976 RepID=UPI0005A7A291|nr:hypothetical protein [Neochlamydia sp. S13]BBI17717.1 Uncharacterized protein NCS13_1_1522 [Neochlamydia sp. S13]